MTPNLRDLLYFEIVAEEGQIGRAALRVGRTQPAVTKCIDRLESAFGTTLLEPDGRGIRLTPVGHVLLQRARALRGATEEAVREVNDFAQGNAGRIRLGAGTIAADDLLPDICEAFMRRHPRVSIDLRTSPGPELMELLAQGELDLVVGLSPENHPDITTHTIARDAVVVAAHPAHPVFKLGKVTLRSLLEYGWILPTLNAPTRQWLNVVFESKGLPRPRAHIEANSLPMLPRLISRTGLLCFMSRRTLHGSGAGKLREVELKETTLHRQFGVSYRHDHYLPPTAQLMIDMLVKKGKQTSRRTGAEAD